MSTKPAVAAAVAKLYIAAGRRASDEEMRVYHQVLASVHDAELLDAVERLIVRETFEKRPPSPAMVMEYVRLVRARDDLPRDDRSLPEDTGPALEGDEARAALAATRAALAAARGEAK